MDLCPMPCTMKQCLTEINQPEKTEKSMNQKKGGKEKVLRPDKYKNNKVNWINIMKTKYSQGNSKEVA